MIQPVKKLLIILMLMVLPLQFSWAAAAAYCQHEINPATTHYGHHEHKHPASVEKSNDKEKSAQVHTDCGYCHAVSPASFLDQSLPLVILLVSLHLELHPLSFSSHIPDSPRRPDRHPVA